MTEFTRRPRPPRTALFQPDTATRRRHPATVGLALCLLLASLLLVAGQVWALNANSAGAVHGAPSLDIAFHYGKKPPLEELAHFEVVVVSGDAEVDPRAYAKAQGSRSALYAYVSIGEIARDSPLRDRLPPSMIRTTNARWNSAVVDQSQSDWPVFFVEQVVAPLWARGFRGFFVDTVDAYHFDLKDEAVGQAQQRATTRTLQRLADRFPGIQLILNRGFEIVGDLGQMVRAVAAESLHQRWNPHSEAYERVPDSDRRWLSARLREVQARGLAAVAIEYAAPEDREDTRILARKVLQEGFSVWVADPHLMTLGVGNLEVVPRTALVVHDGDLALGFDRSAAQRMTAMPLQYLGYRTRLVHVSERERLASIASVPLAARFGAIVIHLQGDGHGANDALDRLVRAALAARVPVAFLAGFGMSPVAANQLSLGIRPLSKPMIEGSASVALHPSVRRSEAPVLPVVDGIQGFGAPQDSTAWISVRDDTGMRSDPVAITPWGGYAMRDFAYRTTADGEGERWLIDPIDFFAAALRPVVPFVPDVSTGSGRRLLMAHVDGDGFASRAEIPGTPFASEVMLRDFVMRYPVPHTISVIQGEIAPNGLYPKLSTQLEAIAREMFALPQVEIASHSFSHPFFWSIAAHRPASGTSPGQYGDHLPIPGYRFDLDTEIEGSRSYIDTRLAPPGKRTRVFLWTGDCSPPPEAIARVREAGLLNMNGGDTMITRANPSLTLVGPMYARKDGQLQVYAPNQNENVFTREWRGPYYGYQRAIEAFELTESPRRLKPIDIYYHTYAASKTASITALHRVYRWALARPHHPVFASEYIARVEDFERLSIARRLDAPGDQAIWSVVGARELRTLRRRRSGAPASGNETVPMFEIDWNRSQGLLGSAPGPAGDYLMLGGRRSRIVTRLAALADASPPNAKPVPFLLRSANGRVDELERTERYWRLGFSAHVAGELELEHLDTCTVSVDGKRRQGASRKPRGQVTTPINPQRETHVYRIDRARSQRGVVVSVAC